MKNYVFTFAAVACLFSTALVAQNQTVIMDSASYSLGVLIAQQFKQSGAEINAEQLGKGFGDAMKGMEAMPAAKCNQIFSDYMKKSEEVAKVKNASKFEAKIAEGKKFLDENGKRPGVTTTASGLQYEVIKMGDGAKPKATDKVTTHYHGTLLNGKVFDSSVQRGTPIDFPVNGVIPAWQEGLQLMPVGSKWKLFVPYTLGYGERGAGGDIGPYETLVFEVELIKING